MISLLIILSLSFLPNIIDGSVPFILNPGCAISQCNEIGHAALYYANHSKDDAVVHIIYSTFDELTISIFETAKNYGPIFNYTALFEKNYADGIQFTDPKRVNSLSFVPRRLFQFNDVDDTGLLGNGNDSIVNSWFLKDIITNNSTLENKNTNQPTMRFPLDMIETNYSVSGALDIDINYPGESLRDTNFPKLKTEPKSFFINIALQASNYSFAKTRFALELYLILPNNDNAETFSSRYIDDQYTPGIFNVWQMRSGSSMYPSSMLWKPVVYQSSDRTIEKNTLMHVGKLNKVELDHDDQGVFRSLFSQSPPAAAFMISLGQPQDGFFTKENYTFIQFTAGLDLLEPDSTKGFVTIALIISMALPALVGIIAIIFIIKRRCSSQPASSYSAIDD